MLDRKIEKFVTTYTGKKLSFLISGGGIGLTEILKFPGASKIVENIHIPSGIDTLTKLFGTAECNEETAYNQYLGFREVYSADDYFPVVINAALSTDRPRQTKNRAFIITPADSIEMIFPSLLPNKWTFEEAYKLRLEQDKQIVDKVLEILT